MTTLEKIIVGVQVGVVLVSIVMSAVVGRIYGMILSEQRNTAEAFRLAQSRSQQIDEHLRQLRECSLIAAGLAHKYDLCMQDMRERTKR